VLVLLRNYFLRCAARKNFDEPGEKNAEQGKREVVTFVLAFFVFAFFVLPFLVFAVFRLAVFVLRFFIRHL